MILFNKDNKIFIENFDIVTIHDLLLDLSSFFYTFDNVSFKDEEEEIENEEDEDKESTCDEKS
jgi:hypothetical protein